MSLNMITGKASFPHAAFQVIDNSMEPIEESQVIPLHIPLFFMFAEKGKPNVPVLGSYATQEKTFGKLTFDERFPYYNHQTHFCKGALGRQIAYVVRVCDTENAKTGSLVVECHETPVDLIQYQRDDQGGVIVDADGNPLPELQADGVTPVTEPGIQLDYKTRQVLEAELYNKIPIKTVDNAGIVTTVSPIFAISMDSPGAYARRNGFKIYYQPTYEKTVSENTKSMLYFFEAYQKATDNDLPTLIRDIYNSDAIQFSFKAEAIDESTSRDVSLKAIVKNDFVSGGMPFNFHVYSDNVEEIGKRILNVSPEMGDIDPFLINILTCQDNKLNPYEHVTITPESIKVFNPNVIQYCEGGADGDLSGETYRKLVRQFSTGSVCPEIADSLRYPFSHLYDSGFDMETKTALMNFLDLRDDVSIQCSTQDVSNEWNTAAEDQSAGSALRAALLLYPEAILKGTPVVRASIYQQAGYLNEPTVKDNYVAATYWRMMKRCETDGKADFITDKPLGRPASEVTIFREVNWAPFSPEHKQKNWDSGLNSFIYFDINVLGYPALQSVYPYQNSVLSNEVFCDRVLYLKKIVRKAWTIYAGLDQPVEELYDAIKSTIKGRVNYHFSNQLKITVDIKRTASDMAKGYSHTIVVGVVGEVGNRVWNVEIPVSRNKEVA